ncbi:ATP12 family protein [Methylocystis parvus]|uniref:ATP12 family protein n=1 Tax=Methylocystis parvus TaxID=134 RepID=UPI003C71AEEB
MANHPTGFDADFFVPESERDPVKAARDPARPLPKRFYKEAAIGEAEGGYSILLDGRPVNTPAKRRIIVPSRDLAEALAAEWAGQGEKIDPAIAALHNHRLADSLAIIFGRMALSTRTFRCGPGAKTSIAGALASSPTACRPSGKAPDNSPFPRRIRS